MADIIVCPGCGRKLQIGEEHSAQTVQCPACHTQFAADSARPAWVSPERSREENKIQVGEPARLRPADKGEAPQQWKRYRPAAKPQPKSARSSLLIGLIAAIGLGTVVVVAFIIIRAQMGPNQAQRLAEKEDQEQRRQELLEAFKKQKPLAAEEIGKELKPLFQGLGQAFKGRNGQAIAEYFDIERMLEEMTAQGFLPKNFRGLGRRRDFIRGMRDGMARAMGQQAPLLEWSGFEIRHLKKLEGNEAVVIVRHTGTDGAILRMRWWVTKQPGTWKIFDMEDLDVGLRSSSFLVGVGFGDLQQVAAAVNHLRDALVAVAANKDAAAAERHLKLMGAAKLPGKVEAIRLVVVALVEVNRGQDKEALATLDRAHALNSDMPLVDHLKGIIFNNLGNGAAALEHLDRYEALLGDDASICFERAEALRNLNRLPEAAAAYRKALDYQPNQPDAFLELIRCLAPGDPRDDLEARFAKLENPRQHFDVCADDCAKAQDNEALECLVRAMRKIDPGNPALDYYQAMNRVRDGKTEEAVKLFQSALAKPVNPAQRQQYMEGFARSMANAGKAV